MPDKKKKTSTTKNGNATKKKTSTKEVKKEVVTTPKREKIEKKSKTPSAAKKNLSKIANLNQIQESKNEKKVLSKGSKKKNSIKRKSKPSNLPTTKEKKSKVIDNSSKKEVKKQAVDKKITTKNVEKTPKKNSITNIIIIWKERILKKRKSQKKSVEKQTKSKKNSISKTISTKETKKGNNIKSSKQNKEILLTKKMKKWFIIVATVCLLIILVEIGFMVKQQINKNQHTIYYDSLNSLTIDNTDIVAVGSSNFKYSTYNDYTKGLEKAKLIKYDKQGNIIFEKMYDKGINTTFSSVISVKDGYIVVGSGEFSEEEQKDEGREAIIIKYDKEGNIVWEKYYQVVTNTRFNKVIETSDGYITIGQSIYANMEMGNHTTGGGIIVKYDFDGNEIWHNNHGGMKSGNFNDIVEVNGDFYVVGKDATDSGNLIKYNKKGEYQWHKNYNYTDSIGFTGISYLDNALYIVGAKKILPTDIKEEDDRSTTNTDALLVKYDLNGKVIFEKNFGGNNYERYNSILAYRDNLYVVGHTSSTDAGMKIDTDGKLMTGILVRYDKDGNILKKESFGGSNNDNLTEIVTDSVSIYISAYSNSNDGNITTAKNNGKDYFGKIIKLDFKFRTLMVK